MYLVIHISVPRHPLTLTYNCWSLCISNFIPNHQQFPQQHAGYSPSYTKFWRYLSHFGRHQISVKGTFLHGDHCHNVLGHLDYEKWYHLQKSCTLSSKMQKCFQKRICSSYSKSKGTLSPSYRSMAGQFCVILAIFFLTFFVSWLYICKTLFYLL